MGRSHGLEAVTVRVTRHVVNTAILYALLAAVCGPPAAVYWMAAGGHGGPYATTLSRGMCAVLLATALLVELGGVPRWLARATAPIRFHEDRWEGVVPAEQAMAGLSEPIGVPGPFACPHCSSMLRASPGPQRTGRCGGCGGEVTVPGRPAQCAEADQWYVHMRGEVLGPVPPATLVAWVESGRVDSSARVSRDGASAHSRPFKLRVHRWRPARGTRQAGDTVVDLLGHRLGCCSWPTLVIVTLVAPGAAWLLGTAGLAYGARSETRLWGGRYRRAFWVLVLAVLLVAAAVWLVGGGLSGVTGP